MPRPESRLVTSEMMESGAVPLLFTGGACNIQGIDGPVRNPGRDPLAAWLDGRGWTYFDPQIHPSTHGREYVWGLDGPQEKRARECAKVRIYEITATTIGGVTMLEVMDDARGRVPSVVWFNGGRSFAPPGLGDRDQLMGNRGLREQIGETVYQHLLAYVNSGRQLRNELPLMLVEVPGIVVVDSLDELKLVLPPLLEKAGD